MEDLDDVDRERVDFLHPNIDRFGGEVAEHDNLEAVLFVLALAFGEFDYACMF